MDKYSRTIGASLGLGADVDEVTDALRALIDLILAGCTVTIGQSMGAYAATMYGMRLGVDQIVTFGPRPTWNASPTRATRYGDRGFLSAMQDLRANPPRTMYADLLQLGKDVDFRGEQHINFGTHPEYSPPLGVSSNFDAIHALRLAQLPKASGSVSRGRSPDSTLAGRQREDGRPPRQAPDSWAAFPIVRRRPPREPTGPRPTRRRSPCLL